jgi:hypothetical protein
MRFPRLAPSISSAREYESFSTTNKSQISDNGSKAGGNEMGPAAVNAQIEAQLKRDGEAFKKEESNLVKILLLGQAGSGTYLLVHIR